MGVFHEGSVLSGTPVVQDAEGTSQCLGNKHRPDRRQKPIRRRNMNTNEACPEGPVTSFKDDVINSESNTTKSVLDDQLAGGRKDWPAYETTSSSDEANNNCYYDMNLAQKCHKMLHQHAGKSSSSKVLLFPEEEWARNAYGIQWEIKMNRWWKRYCTITEHRAGGRAAVSAVGKIVQNRDGTLTILGRFKRNKDPDFRLHLSGRVTKDDFERGYLMTGALQLGDLKGEGRLEITHFAVVPRHQQSIIN
ncbi:uncharacterized protein LOC100181880 [Ciona intestinalis]